MIVATPRPEHEFPPFPHQVFRTNEASLRLWRNLGFTELAVVPKAARLKGIDGLVSCPKVMASALTKLGRRTH